MIAIVILLSIAVPTLLAKTIINAIDLAIYLMEHIYGTEKTKLIPLEELRDIYQEYKNHEEENLKFFHCFETTRLRKQMLLKHNSVLKYLDELIDLKTKKK